MDPKANKPSTPSRRAKKDESDYLEEDECRTAVETESLTDARVSRVPPPVTQSPRDAWANVAPSVQPRIVPATHQSQADRDANEIATSTQRALETLRSSSDPRSRLFVPTGSPSQPTPKRSADNKSKSPFKPFSGHGRPLASPISTARAGSVRTAVDASPIQSSVRTAAARSPDVRTGVEHSARSARLREEQSRSRSRAAAHSSSSNVRTAVGATTPRKSRSRNKSGCSTLHTASANYEIDLRQRTNSMTGPTTNVSTARTISPARGRSPVRPVAAYPDDQQQQPGADYPPLPSEGDPNEQTVELADKLRASQEYTPHISRPILFGTTSGVRTARAISPARTPRLLSERTARAGDSSLKTSRSPASKSEKSMRTGRRLASPANSLGSYKTDQSISSKKRAINRPALSQPKTAPRSAHSPVTTSARSYGSNKSWSTAQTATPRRNKLPRSAHKSASETTPASATARSGCDFSSKSTSGASRGRIARRKAEKKPATPMRTGRNLSSARSQRTAISPDATSSKRTPTRTGAAAVRPHTPDTPAGWPYRASEQIQLKQTPIRISPSSTSLKTAKYSSPREPQQLKSAKSPRSQKETHREAKKKSSSSASRSRRSNNPTSNVSTARTIASRLPAVNSSTSGSSLKSTKDLHSSKTNSRTFSPKTLASARRPSVTAANDGPDMVIETVQTHGNIEIDLCFNFRVREPPGKGFGGSSSPLKPKEVLINGHPIWKKE